MSPRRRPALWDPLDLDESVDIFDLHPDRFGTKDQRRPRRPPLATQDRCQGGACQERGDCRWCEK